MTAQEANTCETCKWWKPPPPPPPGWGGHIKEYGVCRYFANDRFVYLSGKANAVRCADETRAEHTCVAHTPKKGQFDE